MPELHEIGGIIWSFENGVLTVGPASNGGPIPVERRTETMTVEAGPRWDELVSEERERIVAEWAPWNALRGDVVEVRIGEGITSLPKKAVSGMAKLKIVHLPGTLAQIEPWTFASCQNLESVEMHEGTKWIGERAFQGCKALKGIALPSTVWAICDSAFSDCAALEEIALPQALREIGDFAFSGCAHLTSAVIPEGVTKIGTQAFFRCENLATVSIPDSAAKIGHGAFSGCDSLQEATVPRRMGTQELNDVFGYYGSGKRVKYRRRSALSGLFGKK